ncbi:hypothetical protein QQ020_10130 [Fulvivirgaceae bacterium BMA12]|uniref:Uncharacterized protein n=1 Tax=Agaribacillus aureus TaxID=3051825 RepID=A0ABT8L7K8_9BACT|nr:hypothetical protein [Fulvivirgaceae bacterium BMA12]
MIEVIEPGNFQGEKYWYEKSFNATIHPLISFFLKFDKQRLIARYCHLQPMVSAQDLEEILTYKPKYFWWSGADLINAASAGGKRQMVVIETNSCPSGQKAMPLVDDHSDYGGYVSLIEESFKLFLKGKRMTKGALALIYDKNKQESTGYAAAMSEVFQQKVFLIPYYDDGNNEHIRIENDQLEFYYDGGWNPIAAAFKYLTQKPWNRIPVANKTVIFNPIIACLAGGRNKLIAAKAYEFYNATLEGSGLHINMPETIWDVNKAEIPFWVHKFGGHAVIKIPYSNAGQGVFTITSDSELDKFMAMEFDYERFIVQSLIGNYDWSSNTEKGRLYHVGTVPDKKGKSYVSDIRLMIHYTHQGYRPLCIYSRRAPMPLVNSLEQIDDSWQVLGTNLSVKKGKNQWDSDTSRLIIMDRKDFNKLGLGLDDFIEAYIQTVLATIAIDKMAQKLITPQGKLKMKLYKSFNDDTSLIDEIIN